MASVASEGLAVSSSPRPDTATSGPARLRKGRARGFEALVEPGPTSESNGSNQGNRIPARRQDRPDSPCAAKSAESSPPESPAVAGDAEQTLDPAKSPATETGPEIAPNLETALAVLVGLEPNRSESRNGRTDLVSDTIASAPDQPGPLASLPGQPGQNDAVSGLSQPQPVSPSENLPPAPVPPNPVATRDFDQLPPVDLPRTPLPAAESIAAPQPAPAAALQSAATPRMGEEADPLALGAARQMPSLGTNWPDRANTEPAPKDADTPVAPRGVVQPTEKKMESRTADIPASIEPRSKSPHAQDLAPSFESRPDPTVAPTETEPARGPKPAKPLMEARDPQHLANLDSERAEASARSLPHVQSVEPPPGTILAARNASIAESLGVLRPQPVAEAERGTSVAGLAVEIATRAKDGQTRFEIRLDPPDLGRISVQLDVDKGGSVTSRLVVDRADTLDLLRRDAPALERALQSVGLKTDGGLEFSLRDQSFGRGHEPHQQERGASAQLVLRDDELPPTEAARAGYGSMLGLGSGVDIRV